METTVKQGRKGKTTPVLISTLSAAAMGLAYLVYNRRGKDDDPTRQLVAPPEHSFRFKLPFRAKGKEVYRDDSDIGYC